MIVIPFLVPVCWEMTAKHSVVIFPATSAYSFFCPVRQLKSNYPGKFSIFTSKLVLLQNLDAT